MTFVYFVVVLLVGRILFIQLYIAVILTTFEEARKKIQHARQISGAPPISEVPIGYQNETTPVRDEGYLSQS